MKTIIANLKAHQNLSEAVTWINKFINCVRNTPQIQNSLKSRQLHLIVAPSAPFLITYRTALQEFPNISMCSQDISKLDKGSYTGETNGYALEGLVQYAILGHSERRKNFNEDNELVRQKMEEAIKHSIQPVVCYRTVEDLVVMQNGIIAYEPADAIGGGKNYPVETVVEFRKQLQLNENVLFLYGGSVDEQNLRLYLKSEEINGLLVGGASLDAGRFCDMLQMV